jgi:RNA polymerase sigma-70 factor (ECF subfamily)
LTIRAPPQELWEDKPSANLAAMRPSLDHRPLVDADDAALVLCLQRDEAGAAAMAWRRFVPMVRATVRRMLGPGRDEDDVVQEVFLGFFGSVRRLREPALVRSFLFGICLRTVRKEIRRRKLRSWLRLAGDRVDDLAVDWPAVAGDAEAREAIRRFYALLDSLRGESRSLLVVRFLEGKELAEVARLHGMSLSTVQRKLARAVARVTALVRQDPALSTYVSARMFGGES